LSLDLETGTIRRGPVLRSGSLQTCTDFSNLDLGGFVGIDTGNSFCEWFDAGTKGPDVRAT
jgi:hypothetical protein